jgi:hypothetical protein
MIRASQPLVEVERCAICHVFILSQRRGHRPFSGRGMPTPNCSSIA